MSANIDEDSPYFSEGNQPTLMPSFVCYADILGYSQLSKHAINNGRGNDFLRRLSQTLNHAYNEMRASSNRYFSIGSKEFDVKIFTDNIVIGYPVANFVFTQGESELGHIFDLFTDFQVMLAKHGFLVRGGISFGEHYMDNDIVFGDALLAAVGQDKLGGPPYLSLDPTAIRRVQGQLAFYGNAKSGTPQHHYLRQDSDGTVFLNYLGKCEVAFPDGPLDHQLLDAHRQTVERGLDEYKSVPSVRSKYEWVARYHNYYCRELARGYPLPQNPDVDPFQIAVAEEAQRALDHLIDIEAFAAEPGPLTLEPVWHGGDM